MTTEAQKTFSVESPEAKLLKELIASQTTDSTLVSSKKIAELEEIVRIQASTLDKVVFETEFVNMPKNFGVVEKTILDVITAYLWPYYTPSASTLSQPPPHGPPHLMETSSKSTVELTFAQHSFPATTTRTTTPYGDFLQVHCWADLCPDHPSLEHEDRHPKGDPRLQEHPHCLPTRPLLPTDRCQEQRRPRCLPGHLRLRPCLRLRCLQDVQDQRQHPLPHPVQRQDHRPPREGHQRTLPHGCSRRFHLPQVHGPGYPNHFPELVKDPHPVEAERD